VDGEGELNSHWHTADLTEHDIITGGLEYLLRSNEVGVGVELLKCTFFVAYGCPGKQSVANISELRTFPPPPNIS
jgi:hypothetical protein